ncbi:MAG: ATP synthase F1 subunit gamma [Candidatus Omnitrophota bacterium]
MATLRAIKTRIGAVGKIKKITNALEIVALTRLRRMESVTMASRDYFERIRILLCDVASNTNFISHPFLDKTRQGRSVAIAAIFSDKGLCGSFNANAGGRLSELIGSLTDRNVKVAIIGKKGQRYVKQGPRCQLAGVHASSDKEAIEKTAVDVANMFIEQFLSKEIDEIILLYNKFKRHLLGDAHVIKLLPFSVEAGPMPTLRGTPQSLRADNLRSQLAPGEATSKERRNRDYIYEPRAKEIINELVREYIKNQIQHGILESRCAEEMARMMAMKSAGDNADEMIEALNLSYHKSRQAQITKELLDVITAAEVAM